MESAMVSRVLGLGFSGLGLWGVQGLKFRDSELAFRDC